MTSLTAIATAAAITAAGTFYPTTMQVTNVSGEVVTMETATGFIYEMESAGDEMTGDLMSLIMYDNETPEITDDIIISARYTGYCIENGDLYKIE